MPKYCTIRIKEYDEEDNFVLVGKPQKVNLTDYLEKKA